MNETSEIIRMAVETSIEKTIENSNLLFFDNVTLILSILAIIISIWSILKDETSQFKSKFYDNILLEPLQKELPQLLNEAINLERACINDVACSELEEYIGKLRKKILVFKYENYKFYEKIDKLLVKIDNQLVLMSNRNENFMEKYAELLQLVKELYRKIKRYII